MLTRALTLIICLSTAAVALADDNWPDYRGPRTNGLSDSTGLPLKWSETQNVKWKTPIHGKGWASPVVWGGQVWLSTATEDGLKMSAICVDRDSGKILFDKIIFTNDKVDPLSNNVNTYSSPSPVIEEGRVYHHWGTYGTVCIDTKSLEIVWTRRDLPCNHWRGPGSSPLLIGDLLILTFDGADYQYVVALNKRTGETVWKKDRSTDYKDLDKDGKPKAGGDFRKGYATPIQITAGGKRQLISPGAKAAFSYDLYTGDEFWTVTYDEHSAAARTLYHSGVAVINTGYSKAVLMAVKVDGSGDVTKTHVLWRNNKNIAKRSSPVFDDNMIFMIDDGGIASCIDFNTGETIWTERVGDNHTASPVLVDNRIYFFSEEGKCTVIAPAREFKELAVNKLDDGFMACPAVAGKAFFLRSKHFLYRIEE